MCKGRHGGKVEAQARKLGIDKGVWLYMCVHVYGRERER